MAYGIVNTPGVTLSELNAAKTKVDATLKQSGQAADAKTVGDRLTELENADVGPTAKVGGFTWYIDTDEVQDRTGKSYGTLEANMTDDMQGTWFYIRTKSSDQGQAAYPDSYKIDGANGFLSLRDYVVWTGNKLVHVSTFEAKASTVRNSDGQFASHSGVDGLMSSTDKAYLTFLMQHYIAASMPSGVNSGNDAAESGLYGNVTLGRPSGSGTGDTYNMVSILDKVTNFTSQLLINENINNPYVFFRSRVSDSWHRLLSDGDLVSKLPVAENDGDYPNWDNELRIYHVKHWNADSSALPNSEWPKDGDYLVVNIPGAPEATTLHAMTQFIMNNSNMEIWCRFIPSYSGSEGLDKGNPSEWIQLSHGIQGLVPTATEDDKNKFLRGDGAWADPPTAPESVNTTYTLSKTGSTITLNGSDGSKTSVTDADTNTWKLNTASSEGYVTKGSGNANKVWKTDASGNPAWRDDGAPDGTLIFKGAASGDIDVYKNPGRGDAWYVDKTGSMWSSMVPIGSTMVLSLGTNNSYSGNWGVIPPLNGPLFRGFPWTYCGFASDYSAFVGAHYAGDYWIQGGALPAGSMSSGTDSDIIVLLKDRTFSNEEDAIDNLSENAVRISRGNPFLVMVSPAKDGQKGVAGFVPPPAFADRDKFFRGDGTWAAVPTNSKTTAGIVPKGDGNANKVWMTDSSGNPKWTSLTIPTIPAGNVTASSALTKDYLVVGNGNYTVTSSPVRVLSPQSGSLNIVPLNGTPDPGTGIGIGSNIITGDMSVAIGNQASANGVAIGNQANAKGYKTSLGVAIGPSTSAEMGVAIGQSATCNSYGIAIGRMAQGSGIAIGYNATTESSGYVAIGLDSVAHYGGIAIGDRAQALGDGGADAYQIQIGEGVNDSKTTSMKIYNYTLLSSSGTGGGPGNTFWVTDVGQLSNLKTKTHDSIVDAINELAEPDQGATAKIGGFTWDIDTDTVKDGKGTSYGKLSENQTDSFRGVWFFVKTSTTSAGSAKYPEKYEINGANGYLSLGDYVIWTGVNLVHVSTYEAKPSTTQSTGEYDGLFDYTSGVDGLMSSTDKAYLTRLINSYDSYNQHNSNRSGFYSNALADHGLYGHITSGRPAGSGEIKINGADIDFFNGIAIRDAQTKYTSQLMINTNNYNPFVYFKTRISDVWRRMLTEDDLFTTRAATGGNNGSTGQWTNWDSELKWYHVAGWASGTTAPNTSWSTSGDYTILNLPGAPGATTAYARTQLVWNNETMEMYSRTIPDFKPNPAQEGEWNNSLKDNGTPSDWTKLMGGIKVGTSQIKDKAVTAAKLDPGIFYRCIKKIVTTTNGTVSNNIWKVNLDFTGSSFCYGTNTIWLDLPGDAGAETYDLSFIFPTSVLNCDDLYVNINGLGGGGAVKHIQYSVTISGTVVDGSGGINWTLFEDCQVLHHPRTVSYSGALSWH